MWLFLVSWCLGGLVLLAGCNGKPGSGGNGNGNTNVPPTGRAERPDGLTLLRPPPEAEAPRLSPEAAKWLCKLARLDPLKKLGEKMDRKTLEAVAEIPSAFFEEYRGSVMLTIYPASGGEPLFGWAAGGNLAFSTVGASRAALGSGDPAILEKARLKIDLVWGGLEACLPEAKTTMIPGVDGLGTIVKGGLAYLPPDFFLGDAPTVEKYIAKLTRAAGMSAGAEKRRDIPLGKFKTVSFVEAAPGGEAIELYRGNALVAKPTAKACTFAALAGLSWLMREQREGGRFPASFAPYAGEEDRADCDALQQAFTALAMLRLYQLLPRLDAAARLPEDLGANAPSPAYLAAARAMVARDARMKFSYVGEGGESRLGPSAVLVVALCEESALTSNREKNREMIESLTEFILAQQTPEGEFLSHYDPAAGRPVKRFAEASFPGQAILALVRAYEFGGRKDARLLDAARKAAHRLAAAKEKPADPWLMLGLEALLGVENDKVLAAELIGRAIDIVDRQLALAEPATGKELPPGQTRCPDLVGGLDEADPPGVAMTAARGEGLAAALRVARRLGKHTEAMGIARAMERAAVYVVLNQFRAENSYALSKPARALGGFRTSALAGSIRPETTAHAALFLLDCAKANTNP